jgi:cardiolipin synthase A/B
MRLMYLTAITAADQSIDIEAAYFVPDTLMSGDLIKARARGMRIRILLPDKHTIPKRCASRLSAHRARLS